MPSAAFLDWTSSSLAWPFCAASLAMRWPPSPVPLPCRAIPSAHPFVRRISNRHQHSMAAASALMLQPAPLPPWPASWWWSSPWARSWSASWSSSRASCSCSSWTWSSASSWWWSSTSSRAPLSARSGPIVICCSMASMSLWYVPRSPACSAVMRVLVVGLRRRQVLLHLRSARCRCPGLSSGPPPGEPPGVATGVLSRLLKVCGHRRLDHHLLPQHADDVGQLRQRVGGRCHVERPQVDDGLPDRHHQRVAQQHLRTMLVQERDVLGHRVIGLNVLSPHWPARSSPAGVSYTVSFP